MWEGRGIGRRREGRRKIGRDGDRGKGEKGNREGRGIMVEGEGKGEEKGGIELEKGRKKLALTSERNFGTIFTVHLSSFVIYLFPSCFIHSFSN